MAARAPGGIGSDEDADDRPSTACFAKKRGAGRMNEKVMKVMVQQNIESLVSSLYVSDVPRSCRAFLRRPDECERYQEVQHNIGQCWLKSYIASWAWALRRGDNPVCEAMGRRLLGVPNCTRVTLENCVLDTNDCLHKHMYAQFDHAMQALLTRNSMFELGSAVVDGQRYSWRQQARAGGVQQGAWHHNVRSCIDAVKVVTTTQHAQHASRRRTSTAETLCGILEECKKVLVAQEAREGRCGREEREAAVQPLRELALAYYNAATDVNCGVEWDLSELTFTARSGARQEPKTVRVPAAAVNADPLHLLALDVQLDSAVVMAMVSPEGLPAQLAELQTRALGRLRFRTGRCSEAQRAQRVRLLRAVSTSTYADPRAPAPNEPYRSQAHLPRGEMRTSRLLCVSDHELFSALLIQHDGDPRSHHAWMAYDCYYNSVTGGPTDIQCDAAGGTTNVAGLLCDDAQMRRINRCEDVAAGVRSGASNHAVTRVHHSAIRQEVLDRCQADCATLTSCSGRTYPAELTLQCFYNQWPGMPCGALCGPTTCRNAIGMVEMTQGVLLEALADLTDLTVPDLEQYLEEVSLPEIGMLYLRESGTPGEMTAAQQVELQRRFDGAQGDPPGWR
jgi:hypothetical protein